jgi:hypothetical protein
VAKAIEFVPQGNCLGSERLLGGKAKQRDMSNPYKARSSRNQRETGRKQGTNLLRRAAGSTVHSWFCHFLSRIYF